MSRAENGRFDAEVNRFLAGAAQTIQSVRYCWLLSEGEGGGINARPMGRVPPESSENEWTVRFITNRRSRKAADVKHSSRVEVIFQEGDDAFVALQGRATLIENATEDCARWKSAYDVHFPTEADRANAAFVDVDVTRMELWIRGVTPEPFGAQPAIVERNADGDWQATA
jgi:general stress protein 26